MLSECGIRARRLESHPQCHALTVEHGYTNRTEQRADVVRKTFQGPGADLRQHAEHRALSTLRGLYPVPAVASAGSGWLETEFVAAHHGQELLDSGQAAAVLAECGRALARLHRLDPRLLDPSAPPTSVIQHGDFGPNNVLFQPTTYEVAAVLDWEFSGLGDPISDVAWCEWIVRMHHPDVVSDLAEFFTTYGQQPPWAQRQHEMLRRCAWLEDFARRWDTQGAAVRVWRERTAVVQDWRE